MLNVELVAEVDSPAGYSAHARLILRALHEYNLGRHGINLKLIPRRKEAIQIELDPQDGELISKYCGTMFTKADIRVFFEPAHFAHFQPGVKTILFTQWETTRISDRVKQNGNEKTNWVRQMEQADLIMTSCQDAATAFTDTGVPARKVRVIPGPIFPHTNDDELPVSGLVVTRDGKTITKKNRKPVIGYMAQWTLRKNVEAFIRDLVIAFDEGEACGLLKTYGADFTDGDRIIDAVRKIRDSVGKPNPPHIYVITEQLTDQEICAFFNTLDIYYAPSRGEGFSLPASMAAAAGKAILVPAWGGPRDYLPYDCVIGGSFSPAIGMSAYSWDQYWFEIDEREAVQQLQKLVKRPLLRTEAERRVRLACDIAGPLAFAKTFVEEILSLGSKPSIVVSGQASVPSTDEVEGSSGEGIEAASLLDGEAGAELVQADPALWPPSA